MSKWNETLKEIEEGMIAIAEGRSDTEISELTGINRGTVWGILNMKNGPPRLKTLVTFAEKLGWDVDLVIKPQ